MRYRYAPSTLCMQRAPPTPPTVLSDKLDWDDDGIEILGSVPINTGAHFIQFPLTRFTMRYLQRTTSVAVCVTLTFMPYASC